MNHCIYIRINSFTVACIHCFWYIMYHGLKNLVFSFVCRKCLNILEKESFPSCFVFILNLRSFKNILTRLILRCNYTTVHSLLGGSATILYMLISHTIHKTWILYCQYHARRSEMHVYTCKLVK